MKKYYNLCFTKNKRQLYNSYCAVLYDVCGRQMRRQEDAAFKMKNLFLFQQPYDFIMSWSCLVMSANTTEKRKASGEWFLRLH